VRGKNIGGNLLIFQICVWDPQDWRLGPPGGPGTPG